MNLIVGTAAMTMSARPTHAEKIYQTTALASLIDKFKDANRVLGDALKRADYIDEPRLPAIRVYGGTTKSMTIVIDGDTKTLPAEDWFFHSGDQIREDLKKTLKLAPTSEHEAIKKRYDGYWSEYAQQHKANKKATATKRREEAAVQKAYRAESRALRAILEHDPASVEEALLLLEFGTAEEAIWDDNDLRTVMENAARTLRATISA
jgi:hypothetical protein